LTLYKASLLLINRLVKFSKETKGNEMKFNLQVGNSYLLIHAVDEIDFEIVRFFIRMSRKRIGETK